MVTLGQGLRDIIRPHACEHTSGVESSFIAINLMLSIQLNCPPFWNGLHRGQQSLIFCRHGRATICVLDSHLPPKPP
jgi:hypothetical protein